MADSNPNEFTIEDLEQNRVNEPIASDGGKRVQLERGAKRIMDSLLATARERPLTKGEVEQINMLYAVKPPTQEFARFVLDNGREA